MPSNQQTRLQILLAFLCIVLAVFTMPDCQCASTLPLNLPEVTSPDAANKRFQLVPNDVSGLKLVHTFPKNGDLHLLQDFGASAGICTGDVDGDGLPDIFVGNYNKGGRLYRNLGDLRFEDVTNASGIHTEGKWTTGVCFVDIDNDGDLDLYVCAYRSANMLFINDGKGMFSEQAASFGLDYNGASIMMAFADYDLDGYLDGYLVTHRYVDIAESKLPQTTQDTFKRGILVRGQNGYVVAPAFRELFGIINKGRGRIELLIVGQADHLYRNLGGKQFKDVSREAGVLGNEIGLAAIWWDYNDDGRPDLYVSNDYKGADKLYANQGNGTFKNVAITSLPYMPWSSMGTAIGDINNDGYLDLLATDMAGSSHARRNLIDDDLYRERWFYLATLPKQVRRNTLFLGTGIDRALESAHLSGVSRTDWTWSPKFGDFDHDGRLDLFIANGMARDFLHGDLSQTMRRMGNDQWWKYPVHKERDLMFQNQGDLHFDEIGKRWGLESHQASFGSSVADLDRDGDLDLLITHLDAPVSLYRNDTSTGKRLLVRLEGESSNRFGIGAKVQLVSNNKKQTRYVGANSGFMSADEPLVHLALDDEESDAALHVEWPSGRHQVMNAPTMNALLTFKESEALSDRNTAETQLSFYEPYPLESSWKHRKLPYDDFSMEPLLPARQSSLGPPLAVADVNGDGRDDFFIGGTMVSPGHLMTQMEEGQLSDQTMAGVPAGLQYADRDALFFDADSDGDEDLLVLAHNPAPTGQSDAPLNRFYENDGKGNLTIKTDFKIDEDFRSGGTIAAADIDRDGDLDLFVGNRTIPGAFGASPMSGVFQNNDGVFSKDQGWAVEENGRIGMVSAALWSDVNDDGWMDLLVAIDWGTIRLWMNDQGKLVETTFKSGLGKYTGRWNGISAGDLDNDGDIDYLVTNVGHNEPVHGNLAESYGLVVGQLKDNNRRAIIEFYTSGGRKYPLRTRNALFAGIPELREIHSTYASFANVQLDPLLQSIKFQETDSFQITTSETGVLWNDGQGTFQFKPLPVECQLAPSYGALIHDFNGDGSADILLAQNDYTRSPELGPSNGGMALMLEGDGQGGFEMISPQRTGMTVYDQMRSLALIQLNDDTHQDLMIGIHHKSPMPFKSSGKVDRIEIRLFGQPGNLRAVGSRVKAHFPSGETRVYEIQSKSGFATQSSSTISLAIEPSTTETLKIEVRWPQGQVTEINSKVPSGKVIDFREPE